MIVQDEKLVNSEENLYDCLEDIIAAHVHEPLLWRRGSALLAADLLLVHESGTQTQCSLAARRIAVQINHKQYLRFGACASACASLAAFTNTGSSRAPANMPPSQ